MVRRSHVGDIAFQMKTMQGTAHASECMQESTLVGQGLQLVRLHPVLVQQHVVVRGARGALDARVAVQVEVELGGVRNAPVHHRACATALESFCKQ